MNLLPDFHDRYGPWAVIAGASEGIGRAYAHALAAHGINLVTLARRLDPLQADAEQLRTNHGIEVRPATLDLAAPDLEQQFDAAIADLDIGLLVYNACYSRIGEFATVALADVHRMIDVNCRGPATLTHRLAPHLIKRGQGGIILMSSMAGVQGSALVSTYAASKAFDTILAQSLWAELAPCGVDVLACVAGATLTPDFQRKTPSDKMAKAFPMQPEAVAHEGLAALGKRPTHIVGRINRLANHGFNLMSRARRTAFFSKTTRSIYANHTETPT